ncbi:hypothetical protein [Kineosporia sp. NBRC 101731]|uniref:hypothetical protein n=1 Tax=Kineosporia sp. NBRC 101731 TaxID=3032199 RepID=UPI0024A4F826|nr:hypothetical protein [Kineosporia sp. NBRC 101731]GLY28071.1 hypothetical protein Kisp02_14360 [Kineosporia sp. NBRC 101731]
MTHLSTGTSDPEPTTRPDRELAVFNARATGADDEPALSVRARDENGELVGGLTGWTGAAPAG